MYQGGSPGLSSWWRHFPKGSQPSLIWQWWRLRWSLSDCGCAAMTPDLSIEQVCDSSSSYVCAERSERKTYLKVSVLGSQYFCSFWLKLSGLKFSFSSCLPVFTLRYLLSYSVITFPSQPQQFRWSWCLWKKQGFPILPLHSNNAGIIKQRGVFIVRNLAEIIRLTMNLVELN